MKLSKLLEFLGKYKIYGSKSLEILSVVDDSRKVKKQSLFVAISGLTVDGHKFIPDVIKKGATVVVGEKFPKQKWLKKATYIQVKNSRKALASLASAWYKEPSKKLKIIGVTGTKGKTTVSHILYHLLKSVGMKVGLVSSVDARIGKEKYDTGLHVTNPEPLILQKFLASMVDAGCTHTILEVTSHGLDQERVFGINFDIAVLTNITHEHLDYHKTFNNYRKAKAKLFKNVKSAVLNKDDKSFECMSGVTNKKSKIISYSIKNRQADVYADAITHSLNSSSFLINFKSQAFKVKTNLLGDYNVSNILAAFSVAVNLGVSVGSFQKTIGSIKAPTGRLEKIDNKKGYEIFIDFAHTPDSLEKVLTFLKKCTKGKLICIFGCAGERDKKKRSMMGGISVRLADISIFTAEDPRSENVEEIISQIVVGAETAGAKEASLACYNELIHCNKTVKKKFVKDSWFFRISERGEAIAFAIQKLAKRHDVIVICGKGHEKSMAYNGVEYPWSDHEAIRIALKGGIKKINRKK